MHCLKLALLAATAFLPAFAQQPTVNGTWVITLDFHGTPTYFPLKLTEASGKITGELDGDKLQGTRTGNRLSFHAIDPRGGYEDVVDAAIDGSSITGQLKWLQVGDKAASAELHPFVASLQPTPPAGGPHRHEFTPTRFYRQFAASTPAVLHMWPGDSIHTTTVDAGGFDERNVRRSQGGNPQTGPFYIETAIPGDTLVIHINRLKLNRDSAISDDDLVFRATDPGLTVKMKDGGKQVTWRLDREHGFATTESPGDHLKHFTVPLKPMLGCIATAPPVGAAIPTGDSGSFGGNMDFNEVVEGNTVYLPVSNPGALLYFGDAHAAQGDGELNGNALETSMDVEVTVDVIHGRRVQSPQVESLEYYMAMGFGGSLDDALRAATGNMASWLEFTYHLKPAEVAQVLGTSAEYRISEVADRNAGIVLKLRKDRLSRIDAAAGSPTGADPSVPAKQ